MGATRKTKIIGRGKVRVGDQALMIKASVRRMKGAKTTARVTIMRTIAIVVASREQMKNMTRSMIASQRRERAATRMMIGGADAVAPEVAVTKEKASIKQVLLTHRAHVRESSADALESLI